LLSGVLWAANGFNRPDKRTNATGLNKQEILHVGALCIDGVSIVRSANKDWLSEVAVD
jgi:hypothetical protein